MNPWCLILGGSSGLGLATAKKLGVSGYNIIAVYRSPRSEQERIDSEFDSIRALGVQCVGINADALNVEKRSEIIARILSEYQAEGKIKCLVHSIAKGNLKAMAGENPLSTEDFTITLNAMATSLYDWAKAVLDAKLFASNARIIAFTSEGSQKAWANYAAVSAAKAALEAISRSLALEFAPFGITSNCIQAGVTDTAALRAIPGSDLLADATIRRNPFKRLTTPEDVANAVYLLTLDEAKWINGTVIPVNGGEHLQ